MLEKHIEAKVCAYARSKGCLVYKFSSPGHAAVPDRLLITPDGFAWFIEFKRSGAKPTPAQLREHQRLQDYGMIVHVVDNVDLGTSLVNEMLSYANSR